MSQKQKKFKPLRVKPNEVTQHKLLQLTDKQNIKPIPCITDDTPFQKNSVEAMDMTEVLVEVV